MAAFITCRQHVLMKPSFVCLIAPGLHLSAPTLPPTPYTHTHTHAENTHTITIILPPTCLRQQVMATVQKRGENRQPVPTWNRFRFTDSIHFAKKDEGSFPQAGVFNNAADAGPSSTLRSVDNGRFHMKSCTWHISISEQNTILIIIDNICLSTIHLFYIKDDVGVVKLLSDIWYRLKQQYLFFL